MWHYFENQMASSFSFPAQLLPGGGAANLNYLAGGSFLKSDPEEGGLIYEVFEGAGNYGIIPLEFIQARLQLHSINSSILRFSHNSY